MILAFYPSHKIFTKISGILFKESKILEESGLQI